MNNNSQILINCAMQTLQVAGVPNEYINQIASMVNIPSYAPSNHNRGNFRQPFGAGYGSHTPSMYDVQTEDAFSAFMTNIENLLGIRLSSFETIVRHTVLRHGIFVATDMNQLETAIDMLENKNPRPCYHAFTVAGEGNIKVSFIAIDIDWNDIHNRLKNLVTVNRIKSGIELNKDVWSSDKKSSGYSDVYQVSVKSVETGESIIVHYHTNVKENDTVSFPSFIELPFIKNGEMFLIANVERV